MNRNANNDLVESLRDAYAGFSRDRMSTSLLGRASDACRKLPRHHKGWELWITSVSGADCYLEPIKRWAYGMSRGVKGSRHLPAPVRNRAARIGVSMALWGIGEVRVSELLNGQPDPQPLTKPILNVRDFVYKCSVAQQNEFEAELFHSFIRYRS